MYQEIFKRQIGFTRAEWEALRKIAERERRDVRDQAAFLVRKQLEEMGALPKPATTEGGDES